MRTLLPLAPAVALRVSGTYTLLRFGLGACVSRLVFLSGDNLDGDVYV